MSDKTNAKQYQEGFFLRRPVLSTVISVLITLLGALAIFTLPVAQYPDLVPPVVQVVANYPGASPEVIAKTVAGPLEERINGVEDMIYISSTSTVSGMMMMSVSFEIGTDPDLATINVNNKVQAAMASLPDVVRQFGVSVTKSSTAILQVISLVSDSPLYDDIYLSNYALINILDSLKRLPGVGNAEIIGAKDYAIRIWLNPERMAQLKITPDDVAMAVREQNAQYAAGTIGALPAPSSLEMIWQINSQGRLVTPEEFGNIILRTDSQGGVLRVKDVATVELGASQYDFTGFLDGKATIPIAIYLSAGANALSTADLVDNTLKSLAPRFPEGIKYEVAYDTTEFVRISIEEVVKTLAEAMLLVFLVVYLFLQNWRATLIPCLAVPISIIGTFAGMQLLGFSINILTLFGLVLAIGIVVDDAIVVLENVERILQNEDVTPRQATAKAMSEVTAPVIAIVLVLCSVFIPVSFMGGFAGEMYRQFAITIATSVTLSGIVALTLTPALCVLLLRKSHKEPLLFFRWFNKFFDSITRGFTSTVRVFLRSSLFSLCVFGVLIGGTYHLFNVVPGGLVPDEDQGSIMAAVMLPEGTAMTQTEAVVKRVSEKVQALPEVETVLSMAGFDLLGGSLSANAGTLFVTLKSWSDRKAMGVTLEQTIGQVFGIGMTEPKAMVVAFSPPPIMGMSNTGGFEAMLLSVSGDVKELSDMTRALIGAAQKRPELSGVSSTFSVNAPRIFVNLDREKARVLNVRVSDVFTTLGATLGATYINDFNRDGRTFKVYMQADSMFRSLPDAISHLYVRSTTGNIIPITSLVSVQVDGGPSTVQHFNGFTASKINGNPAPGYSSGQAIKAMQEVAAEVLPQGYSIAWTGTAYQEITAGGTNFGILGLSLLLVVLILAAQYERWGLPLAVISAVPFALFGAIFANWLVGLSNDVYTQVAMITLLGLACKNAILIVEFAADLVKQGMGIQEAAVEAARLRFRPIIMTSLAFILGCVPLAISSGAGAASREAIGVSVIGGMLAATILAPIMVPYFFRIVMEASQKLTGGKKEE